MPNNSPQWVVDQIFYQIFPDHFVHSQSCEAGQDNVYYHHAVGHGIMRHEWDESLTAQAGGSTFYDGDLDGISEKLSYLKTLGAMAPYLSPVFTASSVHKYDTEGYRHVDPQFGGDRAPLCPWYSTQQQGMRPILDGIFDHSGDSRAWFDRHSRGMDGARRNSESPWRDWYHFSADDAVLDWLGYSNLPKLDFSSGSLVNEVYRGEDSIVRHQLKVPWGMDDWCLGVMRMPGEAGGARNNLQHMAGTTQAAEETQLKAHMVGKHFGDTRQWLWADAEDATINYHGFTFPLWGFPVNIDISYDPQSTDAQTCMVWMDSYHAGLSYQQQLRMFNQLDSHDTACFRSLLDKDVARLPLAVVQLSTWSSIPCICCGDKVGLDGSNNPFCRKPLPWQPERQDAILLVLYRRLAKLRRQSQALRHGGCQVTYAEDSVVVLVRALN